MSRSRLSMSMSLDGFITGPDDTEEHGFGVGVGAEVLHAWLGEPHGAAPVFRPSGASAQVFEEMMATGAVVTKAAAVTHLRCRVTA